MKNIILICSCLILFSCSKKSESDVWDINIDIKVETEGGVDLLNPEAENSYNKADIELFYLLNGEEFSHSCGNCDFPKNYRFFEHEGQFIMRITPSDKIQDDGSDPITYIQWNENDRDTLQCKIYRNDNGGFVSCTKIWLNGNLEYDSSGERNITIIKPAKLP